MNWVGYIFLVLIFGGIIEFLCNPKPKDSQRRTQLLREFLYSMATMPVSIMATLLWKRYVAIHLPFHGSRVASRKQQLNLFAFPGYFDERAYTWGWFVLNAIVYLAVLDAYVRSHLALPDSQSDS